MKIMAKSALRSRGKTLLRLRIHCLQPPDPRRHKARFGLQEKKPGDWVLHEGTRRANGDILFECECQVKPRRSGEPPDFAGPFVHGKPGERFLYLSWKPDGWSSTEPEPTTTFVRRIKLHLRDITWAQIGEAFHTGGVLQAIIAGTARDGGPACASVPLVGGKWQLLAE